LPIFRQALAGAATMRLHREWEDIRQHFADPAIEPALNFRFRLPL